MKVSVFYIGFFLFLATATFAQDKQTPDGTERMVLYDPLFWKDQLKLDNMQCQRIKEINSEYYQKLSAVIHEERNHKTVQVKAAQSLLERSEEIWETFHPKQRKRWKKMWQANFPNTI